MINEQKINKNIEEFPHLNPYNLANNWSHIKEKGKCFIYKTEKDENGKIVVSTNPTTISGDHRKYILPYEWEIVDIKKTGNMVDQECSIHCSRCNRTALHLNYTGKVWFSYCEKHYEVLKSHFI